MKTSSKLLDGMKGLHQITITITTITSGDVGGYKHANNVIGLHRVYGGIHDERVLVGVLVDIIAQHDGYLVVAVIGYRRGFKLYKVFLSDGGGGEEGSWVLNDRY